MPEAAPNPPTSELVACHECDYLYRLPPLKPGATARCNCCGAALLRYPKGGLTRIIALYTTALVLLVLANSFPFLTLEISGRQEVTTIIGAAAGLYRNGMPELAVVVFITTVLGPALQIVSALYVAGSVHSRRYLPFTRTLLSWISQLEPWVMLDVFMLGVLVAFVKLGNMATMHVGLSLYAFVGLIPVLVAASSSFDTHQLWHFVGSRKGR